MSARLCPPEEIIKKIVAEWVNRCPERRKFLPIYRVSWCKKWKPTLGFHYSNTPEWEPVASVRVFVPTKTLMELRVEDPKYILRNPLEFPDLDRLLFDGKRPEVRKR